MKQILFIMLSIIYLAFSLFILMYAMLFPFSIGMKDNPDWIGWILYPLAIVVMATQNKAINYFENKTQL